MQTQITPQWMIEQGFSPRLAKNFWKHVDVKGPDECWPWKGSGNGNGYGRIQCHPHGCFQSHRISWMINNGPIPEGLWVLHSCDNPPCNNPDHLFIGNRQDNVNDMIAKGRKPFGEGVNRKVLTATSVRQIKHLRATQHLTYKQLSVIFSASMIAIGDIFRGRTWRHVD